jgi:hypothetical protein
MGELVGRHVVLNPFFHGGVFYVGIGYADGVLIFPDHVDSFDVFHKRLNLSNKMTLF